MEIQSFKDEVIDLIESRDLVKNFKDGPIYFVTNGDEILVGQFPSSESIPEFLDMVRLITRGSHYCAVALLSLTADLEHESEERAEEISEKVRSLNERDAAKYLASLGVLKKSISIRFEAFDGQDQSLLSAPLSEEKGVYFSNVIEMFDEELGQQVKDGPFGNGLYEKD